MRILRHQSFKKRLQNVALRHPGDSLRIEILRFGAVAPVKDLVAVALRHAASARDATGRRHQQSGAEKEAKNGRAKLP